MADDREHPLADDEPPEAEPPPDDPDARAVSFPVVGIGASAGGLEALRELLEAIAPDSGLAYVVVQHLDPAHRSHLVDLLSRTSAIPVVKAEHGVALEPNRVYIIPPNTYLSVEERRLKLRAPDEGVRMPVDHLFRSLAREFGDKAIGIVLSGTGSDGTLGVREIRGAGGMAMAQDPGTTVYNSMPLNAIATGLVDYVLPPQEMGQALQTYVEQMTQRPPTAAPSEAPPREGIETILNLLLVRTQNDFRYYKRATIGRRIARRMGINQIDDLSQYIERLRADDDELRKLSKDMLIGVTGFFRDADAFAELQATAIAPLVSRKDPDGTIRIWVAGCATGEEAYSVAILALEEQRRQEKACAIQVFASDIDEDALEYARRGIYPESIAADVPPEQLERYFVRQDGTYEARKQLREAVIFTTQDVVNSPPFSRLDLISCRNLFIYLAPEVQDRVIALFAFALNTGGYLFLGKSDTLSAHQELFDTVSKTLKVFRRTSVPHAPVLAFPAMLRAMPSWTEAEAGRPQRPTASSLALLNQQVLLAHFEAAVVLADASGRIRHFYGPTEHYLSHPTGEATLDRFAMVGRQLGRQLRAAMHRAHETGEPQRLERVKTLAGNGRREVNVTVRPMRDEGEETPIAAIVFEEPPEAPAPPQARPQEAEADEEAASLADRLEVELRMAREELHSTTEEYETANEELRAAHEEAMSMNEELQSTNEELETSKEELQSVNEELTTLNAQLREKVEELDKSNSDLSNLLTATRLATIFLDRDLQIRRFTPAATKILNLIKSDVGRPIQHLAHQFGDLDLAKTARDVLERLQAVHREVVTVDGRWFTMRAMPYRTVEDRIDGVVLTFSDVNEIKHAEQECAYQATLLETMMEAAPSLLAYFDRDLRLVKANAAYAEAAGLSEEELVGRHLLEISPGSEDIARLLEEVIRSGRPHRWEEFKRTLQRRPDAGPRYYTAAAVPVRGSGGQAEGVVVPIVDVTEQVMQRQRLVQAEQGRAEAAGRLAAETSHRTKNSLAIVAGLLEEQAAMTQDATCIEVVREAVARVQAVASLHDEIYRQEGDQVDLLQVIRRVVEIDREAFGDREVEIAVAGDTLRLGPTPSTNLCMAANELLTNAFKYGRGGDGKPPKITVALSRRNGMLRLDVWNSGNPVPADFEVEERASLGLRLVRGIVEDQYQGRLTIAPQDGGTRVRAEIPEEPLMADQDQDAGG